MRRGQLCKNKTPIAVLECAISWEMTAQEIATELQRDIDLVYRAINLLRSKGYVEDNWPKRHKQPIKVTPAGREAVRLYGGGQ